MGRWQTLRDQCKSHDVFAKGLGPPLLSFKAEQHHKPLAITHKWITLDYSFSPYRIQDTIRSGLSCYLPRLLLDWGAFSHQTADRCCIGPKGSHNLFQRCWFCSRVFFLFVFFFCLILGGTWLFDPKPLSPVSSLGISSAGGRSQVFCVLALSPN